MAEGRVRGYGSVCSIIVERIVRGEVYNLNTGSVPIYLRLFYRHNYWELVVDGKFAIKLGSVPPFPAFSLGGMNGFCRLPLNGVGVPISIEF